MLRALPRNSTVVLDPQKFALPPFWWGAALLNPVLRPLPRDSFTLSDTPQFIPTPLPAWRGAVLFDPILRGLPRDSAAFLDPQSFIVAQVQFPWWRSAALQEPMLRALPRDSFTLANPPQRILTPLPNWRGAALQEPMLRPLPRDPFTLSAPPQLIVAPVTLFPWRTSLAQGEPMLRSTKIDSYVAHLLQLIASGIISVTEANDMLEALLFSTPPRTRSTAKLDFTQIRNSGLGPGR